jgi:DNA-binding LacI/PurR family transcriptional regulator
MGYRDSLAAHGIAVDPALVGCGRFNAEHAKGAVRQWISDGMEMDAIYAGDDEAAEGAIEALEEAGVRVPEDVAVVGFDDVSLAHRLMPALTTVHAPIQEAGREGVQQLVRLINGEPVEPMDRLPTRLAIRRSCGCGGQDSLS